MINPLNNLSEQQRIVCLNENNILLTACPGGGKTRTIVHRLAYISNMYSNSRKLNIAITYTNRAADEMEKRLHDIGVDGSNIWVGTIHQFCMKYIIRPYSMYADRLRYGYRVIDEFEKREYGKQIANDCGITIRPDMYFENATIVEEYKRSLIQNHEIDFDDILAISNELLRDNRFIADNIANIIRSIYVDEYQDTNDYQYQIISWIFKAKKEINLLFVGDSNQAIYTNLGGVAKTKAELDALYETSFEELYLTGCYRSTQDVIDFYSRFAVRKLSIQSLYYNNSEIVYDNKISRYELAKSIARIIKKQLSLGIQPSEICVLAPQWYLLYPMASELRTLLPWVAFDAPEITPFKHDSLNPFYLIAWLLFSNSCSRGRLRKKKATELLGILKDDYGEEISNKIDNLSVLRIINMEKRVYTGNDGLECLKNVITNLFSRLRISMKNNKRLLQCYNNFFNKVNDRVTSFNLMTSMDDLSTCFREKDGVVITTIHAVKGEEYDTVIAYGLLHGYVPNWKSVNNPEVDEYSEANRLLYVLFSRARQNIYYFSETGRTTKSGTRKFTATEQLL